LLEKSPEDENVIYKVNENAISQFLVYKSVDGGENWKKITTGVEKPYAMWVHPADPDRIYIPYWSLPGSGFLTIEDAGETWTEMSRDEPAQDIVGDPDNPDKIWIGDNDGLHISNDGATSFTKIADTPTTSIAIDPDDAEHLVLGGRKLYHSYDGGQTIENSDYMDLSMYITDIEFSTADTNKVYVSTGSFLEAGLIQNGRGIYRSEDGGKSWENFSGGLPNKDTTSLELSADGKYLYTGT